MADLLVVRSKVKESTKFNVSDEFVVALSDKVRQLIKDAEFRSKENNRSTLKKRDV
ncbi:DUF1931 domain-containing protein [Candidatus Woesearchaeota archaeon]|nr:DUF1931 domain-containing protein [Candidatus Woesearchaeota archaeon]